MPDLPEGSISYHDEVDLRELVSILWAAKWVIIAASLCGTVIAGVAAKLTTKQYSATVVAAPVANSASAGQLGALSSSLASQFGGLASLAGVSASGDSKKAESIALLQSEVLTEQYIRDAGLIHIIYADRWDSVANKWKSDDPKKTPTVWKTAQFFKKNIRVVSSDIKSGLITLAITWKEPQLAAKWANDLVRLVNDRMREQAIQESERNIAYLYSEASKMDVVGVRQAIFSLLQNELDKEMLARGNAEYALKVIDPAFVPESPSSPTMLLWLVAGCFGGFLLSVLGVLIGKSWSSGRAVPIPAAIVAK